MVHLCTANWIERVGLVDFAFQPIVNIHTGVCYGYEALLRQYESAGFRSIQECFDQAFAQNVLHQVDLALRRKAIEKFSKLGWKMEVKLFYNLDNRILVSKDYRTGNTAKLLDEFCFAKDSLCFEISERHELQHELKNELNAYNALSAYHAQGFKIAIDDFGTGFSGLQVFYHTEPDIVKIDRFFIRDIPTDSKKAVFASSIVSLAHQMGSLVVAEGVETKEEFYVCREIGCDLVQGYLVQKPECRLNLLRKSYEHVYLLTRSDRRIKNQDDRHMISQELQYIEPIYYDRHIFEIYERFSKDKEAAFFPIINYSKEPIGVIREYALKDYAYSRFGRELLQNPAFGKDISRFICKCPIADLHTSVEKILSIYAQNEHLDGILIVDNLKYVGFLSAKSLLKLLNEKNLTIARDQNPLTQLPGNTLIHKYVSEALQDAESSYQLFYFDFDNFKPYNDTYGFRHGDRMIILFAEMLKKMCCASNRFAGHIGGDDFFMGVRDEEPQEALLGVCQLQRQFKYEAESFYDPQAIDKGCIQAKGRDHQMKCFPLMTVSMVMIELPAQRSAIFTTDKIGNLIAEYKTYAKESESKYMVVRPCASSESIGELKIASCALG